MAHQAAEVPQALAQAVEAEEARLRPKVGCLALQHGRRFGPPGTPSALKTIFGRVLTGTIHPSESRSGHQGLELYFSSTTEEHLFKRFWEVEDYSCKEAAYSVDERAVIEQFEWEH